MGRPKSIPSCCFVAHVYTIAMSLISLFDSAVGLGLWVLFVYLYYAAALASSHLSGADSVEPST